MLGYLGTPIVILLVVAGVQNWPLWLLLPSVVLQIVVAMNFPTGKMAMLSARGVLGMFILTNIFIQGAAALALYGLGYGIASLF